MPSTLHIILLLVVVVLLFGTSKLRNLGSDLGGAIKSFKKGMEGDEPAKPSEERLQADPPLRDTAQTTQQRETHDAK
ncbi:twin-arginine translocase TatA/TatE family subunit [Frateuria aurantia]